MSGGTDLVGIFMGDLSQVRIIIVVHQVEGLLRGRELHLFEFSLVTEPGRTSGDGAEVD